MSNKYEYAKVIQQHYGQGWEDASEYDSNSQREDKSPVERFEQVPSKHSGFRMRKVTLLQADLKEYQFTGYPTRVIFRRTLKETINQ